VPTRSSFPVTLVRPPSRPRFPSSRLGNRASLKLLPRTILRVRGEFSWNTRDVMESGLRLVSEDGPEAEQQRLIDLFVSRHSAVGGSP